MKKLLHKLYMVWKKYLTLNRRLHLKITTIDNIKSVIFSILMSSIIMLIPVLIIINMFIYTKLIVFLSLCILLLVCLWIYLYYKLYFSLLKNYEPTIDDLNIGHIYWIETSLINAIIIILGIIIITIVT